MTRQVCHERTNKYTNYTKGFICYPTEMTTSDSRFEKATALIDEAHAKDPNLDMVDGGDQVPMILALEWPEGSAREESRLPQVKISELVAERWLVID